jgi:serine/threonine protein kinase
MVQCASCGTIESGASIRCSHCGAELAVAATAAISGETVAMPAAAPSRARTGASGGSRLTTTSTPDEGRFLPGTLVAGRYRIIGLLGVGGMGEVYRATDLTLGQSVALKFLPEGAAANERLLERFHGEVRVARQVSHANVCRVYDIGEADGVPFISMEFVDGEDLASLLQRIGRLPAGKALEIARKLCAGLAAAHERGIIHRDLKPHNIMLNKRGEVVIMDFGLAAIADELEGAEARNGTPAYMAPEQLRGDSVTARSDIYSLGLIVYELFTGKRPFEADSVAALLRAEETGRPPSLTSLASDVDPAVEKVILTCLQPDPAQRPPTALAVAAALPGGDPLAAALAAGETPSPDLVAASGKREGIALKYALPCLVFVLLGLIAWPWAMQSFSTLSLSPVDFPPDVLVEKARDIAASLGQPQPAVDWTSQFDTDSDYIDYVQSRLRAPMSWRKWFAAESPIDLVYRQSPRYLLSPPDGEVTSSRPPMNLPGMVWTLLNSRGQLRQFLAVAPRDNDPRAPVSLDPAVAFQAAGLDFKQFHEVSPAYAPPVAFDARQAWTGPFAALPDVSVTVELATWKGRVVSFYLRWPWTRPIETKQVWNVSAMALNLFGLFCQAIGVLAVIYFARRNLRLGRGDRRGAFRLAGAALLLILVAQVADLHIIPNLNLVNYVLVDIGVSLVAGVLIWALYLALEPMIRARWPHTLITWTRALAGQFRDPRVGAHLLIGATAGMAIRYFLLWQHSWGMAHGGGPEQFDASALLGGRALVANAASVAFGALELGPILFLLICGLRQLLQRDWLAAGVAALILTMTQSAARDPKNWTLNIPALFLVCLVFALMLLRMGLVPACVALYVVNANIPPSAGFAAWYNPVVAIEIAIVAAMALYGFWRSQSQAKLRPANP